MKVIVEGLLHRVSKKTDFTDKNSGEVKKGKHVAQLLIDNELKNGEIMSEIYSISLPEQKVEKYKTQIGKTVQIECGMITREKITLYGI